MRLNSKFFLWAALNLVWLAILLGIALFIMGVRANGRFPHILFQGGINSAMQIVALNLQYKSPGMWERELEKASRTYGVHFSLCSLDPDDTLVRNSPEVPDQVLETASLLPRPQVEFCLGPARENISLETRKDTQSGFLPSLNSVFLKVSDTYWYGRTGIIPDEINEAHDILLVASSPSPTGNGLFFRIEEALFPAALCLLLSFLWWWPFVLYITRPMERLTRAAEKVTSGKKYAAEGQEKRPLFFEKRNDEIGRLSQALDRMSEQLFRQMRGQRQFIRQIAHELGAPLARARFGLEVLQDRLDGDNASRIEDIAHDIAQVSELVQDVLSYLGSNGMPQHTKIETFSPTELIRHCVREEMRDAACSLNMDCPLPSVRADRRCFQTALCNVMRNAVRYASAAGPVSVSAEAVGTELRVLVQDEGPGVGEDELKHLTTPFFRGKSGELHPGGSGLGMSIVVQCMERSSGRIRFMNRQPKGFQVELFFPLAEEKKMGRFGPD